MLLTYFFIDRAIGEVYGTRKDASPLLDYYTASDLGLSEELFDFVSDGRKIFGSRYYKEGLPAPKALVCFFHGLGGGRSSYLHLISKIVEEGYLVYAFDNTGSNQSEGSSIIGLGHYYLDLKAFFAFLDKDPKAQGLKRFGIGHSWGGYAAMLSLDPAFKVERAVSMAGFVSPLLEIIAMAHNSYLAKMAFLIKAVLKRREGEYGNVNALDIAIKSQKPLLYIQGKDDDTVTYESSGRYVEEASKQHPQIETMFIEGRNHSCYLVDEAERKTGELWKVSRNIKMAGKIDTDLPFVSKEDPEVLKRVFDFFAR